jgi:hypothetical protein
MAQAFQRRQPELKHLVHCGGEFSYLLATLADADPDALRNDIQRTTDFVD